jgi:lysophospholipase L1-like esterase
MAVAFDVLGTASVLSGGSTGVVTTSFTAPAGDDVLWVICTSQSDTITAVTCGGTSMTLVQSQGTDPGFLGFVNVYRLAGGATGSAQTLSANIGIYIGCRQLPFSLSGVSSAAPSSASTYGQSSAGVAVTSGAITCTTGQLIVSIFGSAYSGYTSTIGSPTGGTAQFYAPTSTADGENLAVITSSSSTTTGVTFSAAQNYANINLVFSPSSTSRTDTPASSTVAISGGTPSETLLSSGTVAPASAAVVVTGHAPSLGQKEVPASGTVALSGGTPGGYQQPAIPFANVLAKLAAGESVVIQCIGDSTVAGYGDGGNTNGLGWPGRFAIALGEAFNASVQEKVYGGILGATGYGATWASRYTGTSGAVISVYNGGVDGISLVQQQTYYLPGDPGSVIAATPDVIFIGTAYNDLSGGEAPSSFLSAYQTYLTSLQAVCPNIPIIVGTENPFQGNDATIVTGINAVTEWLVGQSLPLSPALQVGGIPFVWVLDTRQAYGNIWQTALYYNAQHPNAAGYTAQANWMLNELAPNLPNTLYPASAAVAITGGTLPDTVSAPAPATVAITGGAADVAGSADNPVAHFYSNFFTHLGQAGISLTGDTLKIAHCTASYTPDGAVDEFWSTPAAFEVSGTGYTSGGQPIGSIAITASGWDFSGAATAWTEASFAGVRYSIIYDSTPVGIRYPTIEQMPLIGYIDWGNDRSVSMGTFAVSWPSGIGQLALA